MTAWALMGAGLFMVLQIHMSWVLLPPFVLAAFAGVARNRGGAPEMPRGRALARALVGFALGAIITGGLLLPTILRDGIGAGQADGAVTFQLRGPFDLVATAARVLSFASFETNRFLGQSTAERALVFWRHPLIVPFAMVVAIAGVLQPLWMALTAFRRTTGDAGDWRRVRVLVAATIVLVYVSYFFSIRGPQAHSFYVMFPVAALFAFSCWQVAATAGGRSRRWERVAAGVIASAVIMHAGLAVDRWSRQSLYVDRALVAAAIDRPNDRFLGDRRDTLIETQDRRPRPVDRVQDVDAFLAARPTDDLQIVSAAWTPVAGRFSSFAVTVTNRSRVAAWLDIRYATAYTNAANQLLTARQGVVKQILQPGETRTWRDIADDLVPPGATAATITVIGAERCVPSGTRGGW
jgi:hypothetical protein